MRPQYHFKRQGENTYIWDVRKLLKEAENLPIEEVPLSQIQEYEQNYWYQNPEQQPSCKSIVEHAQLIQECDLSYPILLHSDGSVMDGMHRVYRAYMEGHRYIMARRFVHTPAPHFQNLAPSALDYSE